MKSVKNKLTKVTDSKKITSLLLESKENDSSVLGWRLVGDTKLTVDLKIRFIRISRDELEFKILPGQEEQFKEVLGGSETMNFYVTSDAYMFQSSVRSLEDEATFSVALPKMVARIDRREFMRLYLADDIEVRVDFSKGAKLVREVTQRFRKNCYDISAGGTSFLVNKQEAKFFRKGDVLCPVELFVDKKFFTVSLEVVELYPIEANEENNLIYSGKKVSLRWIEKSKEFEDIINRFVFKHIDIEDVA